MSKVRAKDLALVAVAGGLLAFELVSLGEALPNAARWFTNRGLPKPASAAPVLASSVATSEARSELVRAARGAAGGVERKARSVACTASGARCAVVTRDRDMRRHASVRVFSWTGHGSQDVHQFALSRRGLRELRELKRMIDLASSQPAL